MKRNMEIKSYLDKWRVIERGNNGEIVRIEEFDNFDDIVARYNPKTNY